MNALDRSERQPWEANLMTDLGLVRLVSIGGEGDPPRIFRHLVVGADAPRTGADAGTLLGFLTVDNPAWIDEDVRRPDDPTDLRVNTIWLHPNARGRGVGATVGVVAKAHGLFESHSPERTPGGDKWAKNVDDEPHEAK